MRRDVCPLGCSLERRRSMGGEQADGEAGFWWKLTSSEETGWFTRGGKHFFSQQGGTGNKGTGRYIHKGVTKEPDYHT